MAQGNVKAQGMGIILDDARYQRSLPVRFTMVYGILSSATTGTVSVNYSNAITQNRSARPTLVRSCRDIA